MGRKRNNQEQKKPNNQPASSEKSFPWFPVIAALIAAVGYVVVALINRSTAIETTLKPIEFTQTAEARLTNIAMTRQVADALNTSIAMTTQVQLSASALAITETPIPSLTPTVTPSITLKPTQTQIPSPTKTATITPLPPSSYGGVTYGCIPVTYWQLDSRTNSESGKCWDLSKWGLYSDTQLFRIDIDGSNVIEKTLSMNISDFKNVDISFRFVLKDMRGNSEKITPKLAIGVCEPNRPQFEHAFVYYDLYENKLASAITINGFDNKDKYYFYNNEVRNYRLEVRSYDLSIYSNNILINSPTMIKRTGNTSFCLYYVLPEGGSLHSVIDNIFIEKK